MTTLNPNANWIIHKGL